MNTPSTSSSMRVLIVGAGIGGLTLARALQRRGIQPDIIDHAHELAPVGAGIALGLNAMLVYRGLGLRDAILDRGMQIRHASIRTATGKLLTQTDPSSLTATLDPSMLSFVTIHRGELHTALIDGVGGIERIRLNTTVDRLDDEDRRVNVTFSDGRREHYDVVVGADGIHSKVRDLLLGPTVLQYSGYTCWRVIAPITPEHGTVESWGRGQRIGVVPVRGDRAYAFLVANAPPRQPAPWSDIESFRHYWRDFTGDPGALVHSITDLGMLIHHDLDELPWLPAWYRGRVVLLGDAAHAMTPNMGQGAAMSIEDAWVLAEELAAKGAAEVPAALRSYSDRRRDRVKWVQDTSRFIGRIAQWSGRFACAFRNFAVWAAPARSTMKVMQRLVMDAPLTPAQAMSAQ
ncbi:MAG: FAD-dependent monooxygenase [Planctomycetota bacterium]